MLHRDSDYLKFLNEFTTVCQCMNEDSNQFHFCLFNLEIQFKHIVSIENYKTHLIKSLQNVIIQQDCMYSTVQDLVTHADKF